MNLAAGLGVAVREFKMSSGHGFADYMLFVDGKAVGVLEAKPVGYTLSSVELQADKYATGLPAGLNPSCIPSFRMASDHAEDLSERPLFDQHAPERLHQRTNPILGPVGKMVVQHQPLPKQRMRPPLHRVRLQPTVIPLSLIHI